MQELTINEEMERAKAASVFEEKREIPIDTMPIKVDVSKDLHNSAIVLMIGGVHMVWLSAEGAKALSMQLRRASNELDKYIDKKEKKGYHIRR